MPYGGGIIIIILPYGGGIIILPYPGGMLPNGGRAP